MAMRIIFVTLLVAGPSLIRRDRSAQRSSSAPASTRKPRSVDAKLEEDLAAAVRLQRLLDRLLELLERVRMLHCGRERSIRYEVSQLLIELVDLRAGRIANPID